MVQMARQTSRTTGPHHATRRWVLLGEGVPGVRWVPAIRGLWHGGNPAGIMHTAVAPPPTSRCPPAPATPARRPYWSRLTPREITRMDSSNAETDSTAMSVLARGESGIVSVGLNAEEFVTET